MAKFSPLLKAGWEVIPLKRDGDKRPLVGGHHGEDHAVADEATVRAWARQWPDCNPAIVMPPGVIGFDVDNHDADGLLALEAFQEAHGALPDGPRIFHGYQESGAPSLYGTRLFRVPDEVLHRFAPKMIVGNLNRVTGLPGVDVIAPWLRYNVAPGAVHKSGEEYEWAVGSHRVKLTPRPDDVPMLTLEQVEALFTRRAKKTTKEIVSVEPPRTSEGRGKELLKKTRELALLDEGETLWIEGQERGWQRGDGFYVLACALVKRAIDTGKDLDAIGAQFVKAANAGGAGLDEIDAERQWDNAVDAVEDEWADDTDGVYATAASQEPYAFTLEMIERHWMTDGTLTLRFRHDDETFWLWHERKRRYDHLIEEDLKAIVKRKLHGAMETFQGKEGPEARKVKVTDRLAAEIVKHLRSLTLTSEYGAGALLPSVGGVPFLNGWLDAESGVLHGLGPERDIRWNVQANYDSAAECPQWLAFLDSLGWTEGTDERRLLQQVVGYLLTGRKDLEKALLMKGPTRCGKGTIIRVLHALMGEGAVGTSLESIMQNFGLQNFIGKGLASIGDARFGRSDKGLNARLLSLTSNDELPVDVKYGSPLSINLPVRLVIATNEMPNFIEASDALARRFVILTFKRSFLGCEDRGLLKRLMGELPGISRWALEGLRDLDEMGRFAETAAGKDMQRQMIQESSWVRVFVEDNCTLDPEARVSNEDLYAQFAIWATQQGMTVLNSVHFARQLLDAYPGQIENVLYKIGGKVHRGKVGIRLGQNA